MQLKSLRLYILFLVALGYQTEGCVLYFIKQKTGQREIPCPVVFKSLRRA